MIKNIKIIGLVLFTTIFTSCSKEYLETEPSGGSLTETQIKEILKSDPSIGQATVNGLYTYMYTEGVGGTGTHEDFGQKSLDIISDILSCDMANMGNKYQRYDNISKLDATVNYKYNVPNYMAWRYYYKIIKQANDVIAVNKLSESQLAKWNLGQGKAMRAYAYFYLATYYSNEYNPSQEILPLYDEPTVETKGLSSTKEVFDLIVKDLSEAVKLLEGFNGSKDKINKYIAEGLLAYVYGYMGEYNKVVPLTKDIISNGGYPITSKQQLVYQGDKTKGGFNDVNTPSWMWGVDLTSDIGLDLISFWGKMDIFTYSYQAFGNTLVIDNKLYEKINSKDMRKGQFGANGDYKYFPFNKFYHKDRNLYGQRTIESDYVYMRVEEFYLLQAEAQAKLGQDAEAVSTLKPLLDLRYETAADYAYVTSKTGKELQDEIYLQTRIELWGEGKSYLAMKRNKAKVARGENHAFLSNTSYQYNDDKLSLEIPLDEVENNPNIKQ